MQKKLIMDNLLRQLESNLEMLINTAQEARLAATSEESKAENKYDTRGLEASYLAGAQAKRSQDLELSILQLKKLKVKDFKEDQSVDVTAIVHVEINGEGQKYLFVLPNSGGSKIEFEKKIISVITPESPLGTLLVGKYVGDNFILKLNNKDSEYEILNIY